jgi:hypothetical protein
MGREEVQHKDNLREGEKGRGDTADVPYFHGQMGSEKEIKCKRQEWLDISQRHRLYRRF